MKIKLSKSADKFLKKLDRKREEWRSDRGLLGARTVMSDRLQDIWVV